METKKTSLYQLHQDNNAKFVEFAGYQMPIQYSDGIVEEHKFTRNHSGIFDVSHMGQLFIYGQEDLVDDLERIFPLDLKNLKLNHSKYSFLMSDNAGIHDDLIITKIKDGFLIILNAACKENDYKILKELLNDKYKKESCFCFETAHPSKFPEAILKAINQKPQFPKNFKTIENKNEHFSILDNEIDQVKEFIIEKAQA